MYQPQTYIAALALMLSSMICWGSWANTLKLARGWQFQAFYWDYVIGIVTTSFGMGLIFGGHDFIIRLESPGRQAVLLALVGGVIFNIANTLLVAAIELAGMAVAFPVGIGLALVIGVLLNYVQAPAGNPFLLTFGVILVLLAILLSAAAYRRRQVVGMRPPRRGLLLSIVAGLLMGTFYPFVSRSLHVSRPLDAYTVSVVFAMGVALCAIPLNAYLMRNPLTGDAPVFSSEYTSAPLRFHVAGLLGGAIWQLGAESNFIASQTHIVGPAISYAIGQGATLVSALWGVFIWHEFANAPKASRRLLSPMFIAFLLGLGMIAIAPLY